MQIISINGRLVLRDLKGARAEIIEIVEDSKDKKFVPGPAKGQVSEVSLTEEDANVLLGDLNNKNNELVNAVVECRRFNKSAKEKKIDQLEMEIKKLRDSLTEDVKPKTVR